MQKKQFYHTSPVVLSSVEGIMQFVNDEKQHFSAPQSDSEQLNQFLQDTKMKINYSMKDKTVTLSSTSVKESLEVVVYGHTAEFAEEITDNTPPEEAEAMAADAPDYLQNQRDYFTVTVNKAKAKSLRFKCMADRGSLIVDYIEVLKNGEVQSRVKIEELEDAGQDLFFDFLNERHINNEFCSIVYYAMNEYDNQEYKQWLDGVKEVVQDLWVLFYAVLAFLKYITGITKWK